MPHAHRRAIIGLWITCLFAAACVPSPNLVGGPPLTAGLRQAPTRTPFQPSANTPLPETPTPSASAAGLPAPVAGIGLWVDPSLPSGVRTALRMPAVFSLVDDATLAPLRLEIGAGQPLSRWVYSLVTPFPSLANGVSAKDLLNCWRGQPSGPFAGKPLLLEEGTLQVFSHLWGEPGAGAVQVLPADKLLETAWKQRDAWAIVPFEAIEPRWKVLEIDGNSPLHKDFNLEQYPLVVPLALHGGEPLAEAALRLYGPDSPDPLLPASNRDPQRLAVVAMTGVTALVRATAATMEQQGRFVSGQGCARLAAQRRPDSYQQRSSLRQELPRPRPLPGRHAFLQRPALYRPAGGCRYGCG